jgi:hypothetical protein
VWYLIGKQPQTNNLRKVESIPAQSRIKKILIGRKKRYSYKMVKFRLVSSVLAWYPVDLIFVKYLLNS